MLWYKSWLEMRFRLAFMFAVTVFFVMMMHSKSGYGPSARAGISGFVMFSAPALMIWGCAFLGGSGIATQPALQASKGLHGSTLYTLSLPASRLRLLAVRAGIGWLGFAAVAGVLCCEMWLAAPMLRTIATPAEMFGYAGTLVACSSMLYFLSVLMATFLDEVWRTWGSLIASMGISWLCTKAAFPVSANIFRGMGKGSPILAHAMPWSAMGFSLGLSVVLFFAALKIARAREY